MTAVLSLTFNPFEASAKNVATPISMPVANNDAATAKGLVQRLNEIKALDKTNMSVETKKDLRNEVLAIRGKLAPLAGGVYLSAGALILILILLIILL